LLVLESISCRSCSLACLEWPGFVSHILAGCVKGGVKNRPLGREKTRPVHVNGNSISDNGFEQAPRWSRQPLNLLPILCRLLRLSAKIVSRAWRGPTVRIPAPVKFVPLTGGVRPSCRAQNAPLADKDDIPGTILPESVPSNIVDHHHVAIPKDCESRPIPMDEMRSQS